MAKHYPKEQFVRWVPEICTCLHHACNRKPCNQYGFCELCQANQCEAPEQKPVKPILVLAMEPNHLIEPIMPCYYCKGPWHEASGDYDYNRLRFTCGRCVRLFIETIKQYDWSQQGKGIKSSGYLRMLDGKQKILITKKYLPKFKT